MRKEFFDNNAKNWQLPSAEKIKIIRENIVPLIELKQGESLLDVCGGTGILIPLLKDFNLKITECDYSEKMIDVAKENYNGLAEFVVADIENLPFKNSSFDKVICHNSFPHIRNKQKAFNECCRVLKHGGIFAITHSGSKKEIDAHHKNCHKVVCNDLMPSNDDFIKFAAASGFESVEIFDEDKFFAVVCKK